MGGRRWRMTVLFLTAGQLPFELLDWTVPSRYATSDVLGPTAEGAFREARGPGRCCRPWRGGCGSGSPMSRAPATR